jgi:hypothetical protein
MWSLKRGLLIDKNGRNPNENSSFFSNFNQVVLKR